MLSILQRSEAAYALFNLLTHAMLRAGHGERAIGQFYAANTLGAITGVLLTVHLLISQAGIKLSPILGASVDILLGAWLLRQSHATFRRALSLAGALAGMLVATATARINLLKPERLASGVFRHGTIGEERGKVVFCRNGKTASIAVRGNAHSSLAIIANGAPDAAIQLDPTERPTDDGHTMTLLGALPVLIKPDAKTFANIGFGSRLTIEVLLSHTGPHRVDTIEIESATVSRGESIFPARHAAV